MLFESQRSLDALSTNIALPDAPGGPEWAVSLISALDACTAGSAACVSQRPPIENRCRTVAQHPKDFPQLAGPGIGAVRAATILGHADAGKRGQRTFHQPDHTAERDPSGASRKLVATTSSALTVNQAAALQFDKDGLEELHRNSAPCGDLRTR
jgi:hypothetical protein